MHTDENSVHNPPKCDTRLHETLETDPGKSIGNN